jgi:phosphoglycolate phosphatase-like HAD superfamily hydrolase
VAILALDFDGVISDSAPEAFLVALRTYADMRRESRLRGHLEALLADGATADRIRADRLYADFLELMPLGNRAEDYGVVLHVLDRGVAVPDQDAYDEQHDSQSPDFLARFHERFYRERERLRREDPRGWRALLAPYEPFLKLLRRRGGDVRLAIATAKDRASVDVLLDDYAIRDLFPEERILDKETGVSKREHLVELQRRLGAGFDDITFVDDKVNHLESVAGLGVRCALAAWGYNGERERARARLRGFLVCDLESAEKQLFG